MKALLKKNIIIAIWNNIQITKNNTQVDNLYYSWIDYDIVDICNIQENIIWREYTKEKLEKYNKIIWINKWFDETIKNYIKDYPEMEVQTWAIKLTEAEKVIAWQDSEYLTRLANDKWVDVKDLADKIKQKADEYNTMYSKLEAEKDKQIKDLTIE